MSHRPYSIGIPENDPLITTDDHAILQNVTANQHHAKSHTHSGSDGSGIVTYASIANPPTEIVEHSNLSHVTLGFPEASAPGDNTQQGSSSSVARLDHKHARESFSLPGISHPGDGQSGGSSNALARADHRHGREGHIQIPFFPNDLPEETIEPVFIQSSTVQSHLTLTGSSLGDNHTQYALVPAQTNITASRALNTTYTAPSTRSMMVKATVRCAISLAGGNAYIQGKSDGSSPPTTIASGIVGIEAGLLGEDNSFEISFVVAPGQNYRIDSSTANGTTVLGAWFETTF
jgi:hypothetical protein